MTKSELKTAITETLDVVDHGVSEIDLECNQKSCILDAVKYFRISLEDEDLAEGQLLALGWALNVGAVYGTLTQPTTVVVVGNVGDMEEIKEESEDERVH